MRPYRSGGLRPLRLESSVGCVSHAGAEPARELGLHYHGDAVPIALVVAMAIDMKRSTPNRIGRLSSRTTYRMNHLGAQPKRARTNGVPSINHRPKNTAPKMAPRRQKSFAGR